MTHLWKSVACCTPEGTTLTHNGNYNNNDDNNNPNNKEHLSKSVAILPHPYQLIMN